MTPEQVQAMIDAAASALEKANSASPNALIFFGGFMAMVTVIVSLSLSFVVVRLLAVQTLFINNMTGRSVMANEQIRLSTDTQTQAITGQTNAITAMNQTGLNTGVVVERMDGKMTLIFNLAKELGVDVKDIAKHAIAPTADTQDKVEKIAEKPAADTTPAAPTPAAPKPGDEIPVTGEVTGVVKLTAAGTP